MAYSSISAAIHQIKKDVAKTERKLQDAIRKAARQTRNYVAREKVPVAFKELQNSLYVRDVQPGWSEVVADAPHAETVEVGARPHMPPLDPIIAWDQLRGLQGLTPKGNVRCPKAWRLAPARLVAQELHGRLGGSYGAAVWRAREFSKIGAGKLTGAAGVPAMADPETVRIARRIQHFIAKNGTRPHRYMMTSMTQAGQYLDQFARAAIPTAPGS